MSKITTCVDYTLMLTGFAYSLENIETLLGVIILCIQLLWLISKLIVSIVNSCKSGNDLDDLDGNVGEIIDTLKDFKDDLRGASDDDKQEE